MISPTLLDQQHLFTPMSLAEEKQNQNIMDLLATAHLQTEMRFGIQDGAGYGEPMDKPPSMYRTILLALNNTVPLMNFLKH